jgi:hypothetical protein
MNMVGRRPAIVVAATLAAVLAAVSVWRFASNGLAGGAQPFNPLRGKFYTAWNTDRDLVDIEVVGANSRSPNSHRLEPERVLRFRLEKAYVSALLTEKEPGHEIVGFSFDIDTELPASLLQAVWMKGPGHEDIPGVPLLPRLEWFQRTLSIEMHSDWSLYYLEQMSRKTGKCHGRQSESGLFENNPAGGEGCAVPAYPPMSRYMAPYDDNLPLIIECWDEPIPTINCELTFPYRGFGVELRFNHARLPKWRESVNSAIDFLKAKEYRGESGSMPPSRR